MKVKMRILALLLVCALLLPATVLAQPPGFCTIMGSVTINLAPAPDGTAIDLKIDGTVIDSTTTTLDQYVFILTYDYGAVGKTVTLLVNGEVGGTCGYPGFMGTEIVDLAIGDTTAPTVTGKTPTGNNEPIDTVVTATFSEAMDPATINNTNFTLDGSPVAGTVSYNPGTYTATFDPAADLDYSHDYTATLSTAITDAVGNPLASDYSWTFTTERGPYLDIDKAVAPYVIGKKNSGLTPEESTVTLTVTGAGPAGSLTSVVVTDVLPDYINYEGNPSIAPTTETVIAGVTTLTWNVGTITVGTTWTVTFDISSDDCGRVLANDYNLSNVTYDDITATSVTELFPKTYLVVVCPGEEDSGSYLVTGEPAEISVSNVFVKPEQAIQNQQVEVSVSIGNSGGVKGTKTVALYVNGAFEGSQTVSVGPGGGQVVLFWVTKTVPGTYTASVDGREAEFTVLGMGPPQSAPAPPQASAGLGGGLGTGGIVAIIVVVIALAIGLVVILRREST